jgi:hypothetical protein
MTERKQTRCDPGSLGKSACRCRLEFRNTRRPDTNARGKFATHVLAVLCAFKRRAWGKRDSIERYRTGVFVYRESAIRVGNTQLTDSASAGIAMLKSKSGQFGIVASRGGGDNSSTESHRGEDHPAQMGPRRDLWVVAIPAPEVDCGEAWARQSCVFGTLYIMGGAEWERDADRPRPGWRLAVGRM